MTTSLCKECLHEDFMYSRIQYKQKSSILFNLYYFNIYRNCKEKVEIKWENFGRTKMILNKIMAPAAPLNSCFQTIPRYNLQSIAPVLNLLATINNCSSFCTRYLLPKLKILKKFGSNSFS